VIAPQQCISIRLRWSNLVQNDCGTAPWLHLCSSESQQNRPATASKCTVDRRTGFHQTFHRDFQNTSTPPTCWGDTADDVSPTDHTECKQFSTFPTTISIIKMLLIFLLVVIATPQHWHQRQSLIPAWKENDSYRVTSVPARQDSVSR